MGVGNADGPVENKEFFIAVRLVFFFFNDTATTEIYTLSLHDALPILPRTAAPEDRGGSGAAAPHRTLDRKSTRLNSSHGSISYAVFCLQKKKHTTEENTPELQSQHHLACRLLLATTHT